MKLELRHLAQSLQVLPFTKFCLIGSLGVVVDMSVLCVLADARGLGWSVSVSKLCSAEIALLHNYFWNEFWTFRSPGKGREPPFCRGRRILRFQAICGVGIGIAVLVLRVLHTGLGFNLYAANLAAIVTATLWNFWMNARFNWRIRRT